MKTQGLNPIINAMCDAYEKGNLEELLLQQYKFEEGQPADIKALVWLVDRLANDVRFSLSDLESISYRAEQTHKRFKKQ